MKTVFTAVTLFFCLPTVGQIVLDASAEADIPSRGIYRNALAAIAALPDGTETRPAVLEVRPGVYWIDDADDPIIRRPKEGDGPTPYATEFRASHVVVRGTDSDARNTVWAVNRGQTQGADGNFTMLKVTGSDLHFENITFGNYCNVDLDYPLCPQLSRKKRAEAIVQAQIAICHGSDRLSFDNCRFISRLNLCPFVGSRRTLFERCYFECTDDALADHAIYHRCSFVFFSSKPFYSTSKTGAIFLDCDIDSRVSGVQYLTKAGGAVAMIDTRINGRGISRFEWSKGNEDYTCYTSGTLLNGKPLNADPSRPWRTTALEGTNAERAYRNADGTYNIAGLLGGSDRWNPTKADTAHRYATTMTLHSTRSVMRSDDDSTSLRITLYYWDGEQVEEKTETYAAVNSHWQGRHERIVKKDASGLQASTSITIEGRLEKAPIIDGGLHLKHHDNAIWLSYSMCGAETNDIAGQEDTSPTTWYRITPAGDTTAVMESRSNKRIYYPTPADRGNRIGVRLSPQRRATVCGTPLWDDIDVPLDMKQRKGLTCDFSTTPVRENADTTLRDVWLMDSHKPADTDDYQWRADSDAAHPAWYYGSAPDGAQHSRGLVAARRGARLTYIPFENRCDKMEVRLLIDPCKISGQGFGSATGQYLDIMILADVSRNTAYGIRLQRTPKHDKAVELTPMRYDAMGGHSLGEPAACPYFRSGCEIKIEAGGGKLYAEVGQPSEKGKTTAECAIDEGTSTALRLQHTGTVGSNSLLIRSVLMRYEGLH